MTKGLRAAKRILGASDFELLSSFGIRHSRLIPQHPEHWIPGRCQDGDLHGGETVQAVFGFGLEEYGQGIATTLPSEENHISIQFPVHPMCDQNDAARRPARPARGISPFNS